MKNKIDKSHKTHAQTNPGRVFSEVAEAPQAAATRRTVLGDPETAKKCKILVDILDIFHFPKLSTFQNINIGILKCAWGRFLHVQKSRYGAHRKS